MSFDTATQEYLRAGIAVLPRIRADAIRWFAKRRIVLA